jgi:hypothetical protein
VAGFGWLLVSLGLVQGDAKSRLRPWAYLAAFGLVLLYDQRRVIFVPGA